MIYMPIAMAILGLIYMGVKRSWVMKQDAGDGKMKEISDHIYEGALAFLSAEYKLLAVFVVIVSVLLAIVSFVVPTTHWLIVIAFIFGAIFSAFAGNVGMKIATKTNVRTTQAARTSLPNALKISFGGGTVMGLGVAGLAVLGLTAFFIFFFWFFMGSEWTNTMDMTIVLETLAGFSLGAESIALFARVGGGIYTKAADVGADLVGKVEAGIPEDDPRNPATIADNVGDNVGDCAGMAADLFETYAVTVVATMVLASIFFTGAEASMLMLLPLVIGGVCVITSIIGTYFVKLGSNNSIMGALYRGFIATAVLSAVAFAAIIWGWVGAGTEFAASNGSTFNGRELFYCMLIGLVITGLIIWVTEYYTGVDYRPVRSISQASVTGHGTNVIQGLAVSLEATALPAIIIIVGIIMTYSVAGLFGIAIAVTAMLALAGFVVALDAFGPVTDNAGGIAEMAELPSEVRTTTDALDAVGNTTKAVTKGYAIGSAGLGALVLFAAYTEDLKFFAAKAASENDSSSIFFGIDAATLFNLSNPYVVSGLLFGGLLPFLFGGMSMTAVGRAAGSIVEEVRRQFAADPGIMAGTSKPDYARGVDMLTKAAIKEMIVPSLLPVLSPIFVFFVVNWISGPANAFAALGAMLLGVIVTGFYVAVSMTAGGGAWDNAKKSFEDGFIDKDGVKHEKGSDAHKASVTGDTVGDPYKDTAGPAVNPMIKITNIVALLMLAVMAH